MSQGNWWICSAGWYHCGDCGGAEFDKWECISSHWRESDNHNWCERCNEHFEDSQMLHNHVVHSPIHHLCQLCNIDLPTSHERDTHIRDEHFSCSICNQFFATEGERQSHELQIHPYSCAVHRRDFMNQNNLNNHLASSAHQSADYICPAPRCGRKFVSYGALALHLESGYCRGGTNSQQVDNRVAGWDNQNLITNTSQSQSLLQNYAPSSSSYGPTSMLATSLSYSAAARQYECFFCHKLFRTLGGLNQHLTTPTHAYETHQNLQGQKMYHCPSHRCPKEFLSLSGFVQHVESDSCGARQFHGVANAIQKAVGGGGRKRMSPY